jgi:Flp pilus assembly pilin Flp
MKTFWHYVWEEAVRFWKETDGQDLVEYALIVAAVALGMVAAVRGIATALSSIYESISQALASIS